MEKLNEKDVFDCIDRELKVGFNGHKFVTLTDFKKQILNAKDENEQNTLLQNFICSWISASVKELTDVLKESADVMIYESQPIAVSVSTFHQFVINYDNDTEQWAVLLRVEDGFYVVGGYKLYRLLGYHSEPTLPSYVTTNHANETFINVETGEHADNDELLIIALELLDKRLPNSFELWK